ncbi:hypothetical protein I3843_09G155000 [Carya illinoinensis]|nr:hypothetical protein I3843_09G155000 [Carya illinoinensis]
MSRVVQKEEQVSSNWECIEAIKRQDLRLDNLINEVKTTLVEFTMSLNATNLVVEESGRDMETLKRETNANLERLDRRMVETNGQRPPPSPNSKGMRPLWMGPRQVSRGPYVDHYFHAYEVPRHERVSTACFYLEGKSSKWRKLGWTAIEKEFLMQFGSSPTINHHGQLAKLRQESKVHSYIEEYRQLQTLVRGWSEEALKIKLKQPSKIQEAMRMAEILEESTNMEKGQSKEMGSEGICFKCGEIWGIRHKYRLRKVYMLVDERSEEEDDGYFVEFSSQEYNQEETKVNKNYKETELSLNTLMGTQKHTSMRVMAGIEIIEVPLLVDSGSTHNFINSTLVAKVGLNSIAIKPFEIKMASGDKMKCEGLVKEVKMNVQGVRVVTDLHILHLVELDVVLGNLWLKGLGRIVLDYKKRTMEFKLGFKKNRGGMLGHHTEKGQPSSPMGSCMPWINLAHTNYVITYYQQSVLGTWIFWVQFMNPKERITPYNS